MTARKEFSRELTKNYTAEAFFGLRVGFGFKVGSDLKLCESEIWGALSAV
jgi:hypothetical protein